MIILDEQLLGLQIEEGIARWYRGRVCFITDLRPGTVIKDDGIATLLRTQNHPTFVTINESDFWLKIDAHPRYCVVCFVLTNSRASEIPIALRELFRHPQMRSKADRMGKVIRVRKDAQVHYYATDREQQIMRFA